MLYALYARHLRSRLLKGPLPAHVALVMDGNRRWAKEMGLDNPSQGHRHGVEHIETVIGWCADLDIRHVTIYVASVDNVRKRESAQVAFYMGLIEEIIAGRLVDSAPRWRLHVAGRLDELPDPTAHALKLAIDRTRDREGFHLTLAIGYDGRQEVVDALRSVLTDRADAGVPIDELARTITADDIAARLYTAGRPDPDLIIRTSGEQRLSGFLIWQSANARLHFCEVYWPGFRHIDFLRALRSYAARRPSSHETSNPHPVTTAP
ncbi:polyprenyl diphosphate synthase [Nonomuraea sp. NPDC050227]|uniref:polyprenyl diphosphate synthase n=1 Tax=Nonomuraea sp. NPDC050227 TaxID=3364360 RepID=UPI0037979D08